MNQLFGLQHRSRTDPVIPCIVVRVECCYGEFCQHIFLCMGQGEDVEGGSADKISGHSADFGLVPSMK